MKKRRTSGARGLLVWAIILTLIAYFGITNAFKNNEENVKTYLENGDIYDLVTSGNVALRVLNIEKTNMQVENSLIYLVESNSEILMLEARRDDKDLKKLFDNKEKLANGEYYLAVKVVQKTERKGGRGSRRTVVNITAEFATNFIAEVSKSKDLQKAVKYDNKIPQLARYLSLTDYKSSTTFQFWITLVLGLIGLLLFYASYRKIKSNLENYRELEEICPEVVGDMARLTEEAEYIDKKLKLLVYKANLITYYKGFSFTKLSDLQTFFIQEHVYKGKNNTKTYTYTIELVYMDNSRESFNIKKIRRKKTMENVALFNNFIQKNYPNLVNKSIK